MQFPKQVNSSEVVEIRTSIAGSGWGGVPGVGKGDFFFFFFLRMCVLFSVLTGWCLEMFICQTERSRHAVLSLRSPILERKSRPGLGSFVFSRLSIIRPRAQEVRSQTPQPGWRVSQICGTVRPSVRTHGPFLFTQALSQILVH